MLFRIIYHSARTIINTTGILKLIFVSVRIGCVANLTICALCLRQPSHQTLAMYKRHWTRASARRNKYTLLLQTNTTAHSLIRTLSYSAQIYTHIPKYRNVHTQCTLQNQSPVHIKPKRKHCITQNTARFHTKIRENEGFFNHEETDHHTLKQIQH